MLNSLFHTGSIEMTRLNNASKAENLSSPLSRILVRKDTPVYAVSECIYHTKILCRLLFRACRGTVKSFTKPDGRWDLKSIFLGVRPEQPRRWPAQQPRGEDGENGNPVCVNIIKTLALFMEKKY